MPRSRTDREVPALPADTSGRLRPSPVGGQLPWPIRFTVDIFGVGGPDRTMSVLTWLNDAKAVALAVTAYLRAYPTATVHAVNVTALGPAPRSADGTVHVGADPFDRLEF